MIWPQCLNPPVGQSMERGESTMVHILSKNIEQETISQRRDVIFFSNTEDQIWKSKFLIGSSIRVDKAENRNQGLGCI